MVWGVSRRGLGNILAEDSGSSEVMADCGSVHIWSQLQPIDRKYNRDSNIV